MVGFFRSNRSTSTRGSVNAEAVLLCALVALGSTLALMALSRGNLADALSTNGTRLLCWVSVGTGCGKGGTAARSGSPDEAGSPDERIAVVTQGQQGALANQAPPPTSTASSGYPRLVVDNTGRVQVAPQSGFARALSFVRNARSALGLLGAGALGYLVSRPIDQVPMLVTDNPADYRIGTYDNHVVFVHQDGERWTRSISPWDPDTGTFGPLISGHEDGLILVDGHVVPRELIVPNEPASSLLDAARRALFKLPKAEDLWNAESDLYADREPLIYLPPGHRIERISGGGWIIRNEYGEIVSQGLPAESPNLDPNAVLMSSGGPEGGGGESGRGPESEDDAEEEAAAGSLEAVPVDASTYGFPDWTEAEWALLQYFENNVLSTWTPSAISRDAYHITDSRAGELFEIWQNLGVELRTGEESNPYLAAARPGTPLDNVIRLARSHGIRFHVRMSPDDMGTAAAPLLSPMWVHAALYGETSSLLVALDTAHNLQTVGWSTAGLRVVDPPEEPNLSPLSRVALYQSISMRMSEMVDEVEAETFLPVSLDDLLGQEVVWRNRTSELRGEYLHQLAAALAVSEQPPEATEDPRIFRYPVSPASDSPVITQLQRAAEQGAIAGMLQIIPAPESNTTLLRLVFPVWDAGVHRSWELRVPGTGHNPLDVHRRLREVLQSARGELMYLGPPLGSGRFYSPEQPAGEGIGISPLVLGESPEEFLSDLGVEFEPGHPIRLLAPPGSLPDQPPLDSVQRYLFERGISVFVGPESDAARRVEVTARVIELASTGDTRQLLGAGQGALERQEVRDGRLATGDIRMTDAEGAVSLAQLRVDAEIARWQNVQNPDAVGAPGLRVDEIAADAADRALHLASRLAMVAMTPGIEHGTFDADGNGNAGPFQIRVVPQAGFDVIHIEEMLPPAGRPLGPETPEEAMELLEAPASLQISVAVPPGTRDIPMIVEAMRRQASFQQEHLYNLVFGIGG